MSEAEEKEYAEPRGAELAASDELLFRQIKPMWVEADGKISSQNFEDASSDKGLYSVDRSSKTTAEASFALATGNGLESHGVLAFTVKDAVPLKTFDDAEMNPANPAHAPNPAHAVVDFRNLGRGARKSHAKRLRKIACAGGWRHTPDSNPLPPKF